ncbi:MAG: outer membrane lipoprotein-sorting protein [Elusimicrobia bacterium]|nr:outer membrane lipoprotein-sorting protein [Elusimicrobiota bacterium]
MFLAGFWIFLFLALAQAQGIAAPSVVPPAAPPVLKLTPKEIVDRGLEVMRGIKSSHARVAMRIVRPSYVRELEVESFHQGKEKSFLVIHKPDKEKGNRTLRLGKDIWTYTRETEQAIKVPFSMMHTSWMGSDFTYEDMTKLDSFVTDYGHKIIEEIPDPKKRSDYQVTIEMIPHDDAPVVWGKVVWMAVVSKDGLEVIPVGEKDYNERGELIRDIALDKIKMMGGRRIPLVTTCRPMKKKGQETEIEYKSVSFDEKFDEKIFTKKTLEEGLPK